LAAARSPRMQQSSLLQAMDSLETDNSAPSSPTRSRGYSSDSDNDEARRQRSISSESDGVRRRKGPSRLQLPHAHVRDATPEETRRLRMGLGTNGSPLAVPSSPRERPGHRTSTPWVWTTTAMLAPATICWLFSMPHACAIFLAAGARMGPMRFLLSLLPEVRDVHDFEDRRYRVRQSVSLVSVCVAIYALIPDEHRMQQGWKQNLVTMETSMASGIAATYGYSVAGGVPGGLLAEYVVSYMGKKTVGEIAPIVGERIAKASVSLSLFAVMGMYMEWLAICAYAFAHQKEPRHAFKEHPH